MPRTKIIPTITWNWSGMHHQDSLKLTDRWEDDYGSGNRYGRDYWHARRAFLNSYHFREQKGFKDKFKRSMKEFNEATLDVKRSVKEFNKATLDVITNYVRELSRRRLRVKVFRVKLGLPSLALLSMRCFTPWLNKTG